MFKTKSPIKSMQDVGKALVKFSDAMGYKAPIDTPNRDFLAEFLEKNNIKKTLVSQYLGYSQNWLTQMANDKRRDMTDATLQSILKKLHIDWTQDTFINVKATKEHTAYRTRPCAYKQDKHKEILQRAMWDGLFVKA